MNYLKALCGGVVFISATAFSQDSLQRSTTALGGQWLTKGNFTSFVTVGQAAAATDVNAGGTWSGTVGFVLPNSLENNNPPVAIAPNLRVFVQEGAITLEGFDPDGDEIAFEIVTPPALGSLELNQNGVPGGYVFTPNIDLNPGDLYQDEVVFKVIEASGPLSSEEATYQFEFVFEDADHVINDLSFDGANMNISWSDAVPNASYAVLLNYYDISDPTSPQFKTLLDQSFVLDSLQKDSINYTVSTEVSATDHPFIYEGSKVFVTAVVVSENGQSVPANFVLENGAGGRVEASEDGLFFAFSSDMTVRENNTVTLNLVAVELSDAFSIANASLELLERGTQGVLSTPTVLATDAYTKTWAVDFESIEEVGGVEQLSFRVFNDARNLFDTAYFEVTVLDVNDAPTISEVANQVTSEDTEIAVEVFIQDPDNAVEVIVESNESTSVPVSYSNGLITISPSNDYSGVVSVNVIVKEIGTPEAYVGYTRFDVDVLNVNDAPIVVPISDQVLAEDNELTLVLGATDVDADLPVFEFTASVSDPSAVALSVEGNNVVITPLADVNGTFTVSVYADDNTGTATSVSKAETFTLQVNPVNDMPVILRSFETQQLVSGIPDYTIDLSAYFDDVENGSDLLYAATGNDSVALTFNGSTMTISPNSGFNGVEDVVISASDGELQVAQTLTFVAVEVSADIVVANAIGTVNLQEDFGVSTYDASTVFSDVNNASTVFNYSLVGASYVNAQIDATGLITFTASENYFGTESLFLVAEANGVSNFTTFDVVISSVNDAPAIASVESQSVFEDEIISNIFVGASDVDNSLGELILTVNSNNQALVADSDIGVAVQNGGFGVTLTPIPDAYGELVLSVSLSDGQEVVNSSFSLSILEVNDAPVADATSALPSATQDAAYTADFAAFFSDIDGDNLIFTVSQKPDWMVQTGAMLSGTPTNDDVGAATVAILAEDGRGLSASATYSLTVDNVNDAPTLAAIDSRILDEGAATEIVAVASDIDGDALTIEATSANASAATVAVNGNVLTVTAVSPEVSSVNIVVTASDGTLSQSTSFDVVIKNILPTVQATLEDQSIRVGETLQLEVSNNFSDVGSLSYVASSADPSIAQVSTTGGTLEMVGIAEGTTEITIEAVDVAGASVSTTFSVSTLVTGLPVADYLRVYPNPATNRIEVKLGGDANLSEVAIFSIVGKRMISTRSQSVDISDLPSGTYLVKVATTEGKTMISKVIKK